MAYHYTGQQFSLGASQAVLPTRTVSAPAAGGISSFSYQRFQPGQSPRETVVTLKPTLDGENIGYIYLFAGFYDQASNSIFVADQDYLESE